jgi:hypothetical protein
LCYGVSLTIIKALNLADDAELSPYTVIMLEANDESKSRQSGSRRSVAR